MAGLRLYGPAVADEFDNPTTDIRKDRCSKCMRGCEMRGMVANFGGFLSIKTHGVSMSISAASSQDTRPR